MTAVALFIVSRCCPPWNTSQKLVNKGNPSLEPTFQKKDTEKILWKMLAVAMVRKTNTSTWNAQARALDIDWLYLFIYLFAQMITRIKGTLAWKIWEHTRYHSNCPSCAHTVNLVIRVIGFFTRDPDRRYANAVTGSLHPRNLVYQCAFCSLLAYSVQVYC